MIDSKNIQQHLKYKILLVGDNGIDEYQYGIVNRISPEAPVPIFQVIEKENRPGMAGNVKKNLEFLGCEVIFLYDKTSIKTRLIDQKSGQHIVRIDKDIESRPLEIKNENFNIYDAVVISDYNKGTVTYQLIEQIQQRYSGPIFVDTKKKDLAKFNKCIVKINKLEFSQIKSLCDNLIVTLGKDGAEYQGKIYKSPIVEVSDVCGAGDTFLSALTFKFLENKNIDESIIFANKAASLTVQHRGAYAPKLGEIL